MKINFMSIHVKCRLHSVYSYVLSHHRFRGFCPQSRQNAKLFLQSSELGLPQPLTRRRISPPFRGEGHTRWRERGWESPNSNEGTYTVDCGTLICTLWFCHSVVNIIAPEYPVYIIHERTNQQGNSTLYSGDRCGWGGGGGRVVVDSSLNACPA
jgi:hypothetical protein